MSTIPPVPTPPMTPTPAPGNVIDKVKPPAIAVIVATAVGMAFGVLGLLANVLGIALIPLAPEGEAGQGGQIGAIMGGGMGIASNIIGLLIGAFIIYAMTKMMRLEQWGLSMGGAILAMIPCLSPCCVLGLPFGIWAIVVLTQPDVKAAFNSTPRAM